jgi:hypothetical protein
MHKSFQEMCRLVKLFCSQLDHKKIKNMLTGHTKTFASFANVCMVKIDHVVTVRKRTVWLQLDGIF